MSDWAGLEVLLRAPILSGHDFAAVPVVFDRSDSRDSVGFRTGDAASPGVWIDFDSAISSSDYGTFDGADSRIVQGVVDISVLGEPLEGVTAAMVAVVDLLEGYYKADAGGEVEFLLGRADRSPAPFPDGDWLRLDWRCPFYWFRGT